MIKTPPLGLLITVATVVRTGSLKRAAEELMVTPSAVSHRVRTLEDMLGRTLFDRVGQGVQASAQAHQLSEVMAKALQDIGSAWDVMHAEAQTDVVRVRCMEAFAGYFILPRMGDFKRRFPRFELDITSFKYIGGATDLRYAILIKSGQRPNADWWSEEVMPLCSNAIIARHGRDDLVKDGKLSGPLICYPTGTMIWSGVAEALGLQIQPGAAIVNIDSVEAACIAAERGVGVALAPEFTARRLAQSGKVRIVGSTIVTGMSYWLATKRDRKDAPEFTNFRRWLMRTVLEDRAKVKAGQTAD